MPPAFQMPSFLSPSKKLKTGCRSGFTPLADAESRMEVRDILKSHRTWEDGTGLLLGLTIGLSPWLYDEPTVPMVVVNSALTGLTDSYSLSCN